MSCRVYALFPKSDTGKYTQRAQVLQKSYQGEHLLQHLMSQRFWSLSQVLFKTDWNGLIQDGTQFWHFWRQWNLTALDLSRALSTGEMAFLSKHIHFHTRITSVIFTYNFSSPATWLTLPHNWTTILVFFWKFWFYVIYKKNPLIVLNYFATDKKIY